MNKKVELEQKIIDFLQQLEPKENFSEDNFSKPKENKFAALLKIKKNYDQISLEIHEYQLLEQTETTPEGKTILVQEIAGLKIKKNRLIEEVKQELVSWRGIEKSVIIEIRPGTGGDEAGLFVDELYCMYANFAEKRGWEVEMIKSKRGYKDTFSFVSFLVKGEGVFNCLKNEAGVHRVQRVPVTAKGSTKHTSTATVAVLPEPQDVVLNIQESDLEYETCRSSKKAGGQHVNTTDSAVKVTYAYSHNGKTETITATSQDGRSQHDNKKKALAVLKSRLWEKLQSEKEKEIGSLRSAMIGTAERSEKFRTYNFKDNRITDKRLNLELINKFNSLTEINLEEICQRSIDYEVEKELKRLSEELIRTK